MLEQLRQNTRRLQPRHAGRRRTLWISASSAFRRILDPRLRRLRRRAQVSAAVRAQLPGPLRDATGNDEALDMVLLTLRAMAKGGMHDQLGGGFHRYSVDDHWFVPHFEKMLYDQAQLAISYLEAFQITRDEIYAATAHDIFSYVPRDMTHPEGGFYSAEDADSAVPEDPAKKGKARFMSGSGMRSMILDVEHVEPVHLADALARAEQADGGGVVAQPGHRSGRDVQRRRDQGRVDAGAERRGGGQDFLGGRGAVAGRGRGVGEPGDLAARPARGLPAGTGTSSTAAAPGPSRSAPPRDTDQRVAFAAALHDGGTVSRTAPGSMSRMSPADRPARTSGGLA